MDYRNLAENLIRRKAMIEHRFLEKEDEKWITDDELDFEMLDLEDKLDRLLEDEICPRCCGCGCNYCLMLEY